MSSFRPNPNDVLPKIWDYSLVTQMNNACGLASVLMAIDPNRSARIRLFLDEIWTIIQPLVFKLNPFVSTIDQQDQYVLEYLLLKIQGTGSKNFIYDYLASRFSYAYEDQRVVNNYLLTNKREKYIESSQIPIAKAYDNYILDGDLINTYMLQDELETYKTDIELKLIMELFGFRYIPTESGDGTGALFFTKKNIETNLETLCEAHINPDRRILLGLTEHWVYVTGLYPDDEKEWRMKKEKFAAGYAFKDFIIVYNDPLGPDEIIEELQYVDSNKRFYIFEYRNENLKWLWDPLTEAIKKDIQIELEQMRQIELQLQEGTTDIEIADDLIRNTKELQIYQKENEIRTKYTHFKPIEIPKEDWLTQIIDTSKDEDDGWSSMESNESIQPIININNIPITNIQPNPTLNGQSSFNISLVKEDNINLSENLPISTSAEKGNFTPTPIQTQEIKPSLKNQTISDPSSSPNPIPPPIQNTSSNPIPPPIQISNPDPIPIPIPIPIQETIPTPKIRIPSPPSAIQEAIPTQKNQITPLPTTSRQEPIEKKLENISPQIPKQDIILPQQSNLTSKPPQKAISRVYRPIKQEPPSREGLPELSTIPKMRVPLQSDNETSKKEIIGKNLTQMPLSPNSKQTTNPPPKSKSDEPLPKISPLPPPPSKPK